MSPHCLWGLQSQLGSEDKFENSGLAFGVFLSPLPLRTWGLECRDDNLGVTSCLGRVQVLGSKLSGCQDRSPLGAWLRGSDLIVTEKRKPFAHTRKPTRSV